MKSVRNCGRNLTANQKREYPSDPVSTPRAIEGIGLVGLVVGIMAAFGGATLLIVLILHSGLSSIYAISEQSHIPFLVLLATPFWGGFLIACAVNSVRWLLKHVTRS